MTLKELRERLAQIPVEYDDLIVHLDLEVDAINDVCEGIYIYKYPEFNYIELSTTPNK